MQKRWNAQINVHVHFMLRHLSAVAFITESDSKEILKSALKHRNISVWMLLFFFYLQIKQRNRVTWKELSSSKSQKYKVEESCRQTERITPFIHFPPPFLFLLVLLSRAGYFTSRMVLTLLLLSSE